MAAIDINREIFEQELAKDKPLLVEYWAPWCTYCRRIGPAYEKIAQEYGDRITVARVNTDENPQLEAEQQIEVIPTLILYKNGRAAASIVAPESKAMIDSFIREAAEI